MLKQGNRGDAEAFGERVTAAVADVVRRQRDIGIDILNDGEMGRVSYASYVIDRLTGFEGRGRVPVNADFADFPGWAASMGVDAAPMIEWAACSGDVVYTDASAVQTDLRNVLAAVAPGNADTAFMTAASPGVISLFFEDQHFGSHETYVSALADAMKTEYDAIHQAGVVLQLDCPDLAAGKHVQFAELSLTDWLDKVRLHIEAINHATRDIPPEAMRMHLCWGNYEGPHQLDVPLADIIELVLEARPAGISFEAANPRHEHESRVFEDVRLPDDKVLLPGVLDTTTNFVEHPELVAERILRFVDLVGPEQVHASSDCGFATLIDHIEVHPEVVWAKLRSLVEGAAIATQRMRSSERRRAAARQPAATASHEG